MKNTANKRSLNNSFNKISAQKIIFVLWDSAAHKKAEALKYTRDIFVWKREIKMIAVRSCERWNIPTFVVARNSKLGKSRMFWIYQKYCAKIVSKISRNTRSDLNSDWIYNYDYGMQGLRLQLSMIVIIVGSIFYKSKWIWSK